MDVVVEVAAAPLVATVVVVAPAFDGAVVVVTRAVFAGAVDAGIVAAGAVLTGLAPIEGGFHPRSVLPAHWPVSRLLSRPHSL